jgi:putative redox protein
VAKPPVDLELVWDGDLRFKGTAGALSLTLDGDAVAAPSPVQALAFALAGCMAADLVHILRKGRHEVGSVRARFHGERADTEPRRFVRIDLRFVVGGDAPDDRIERALALSRETYCSVWHSLRPDIGFTVSFERAPAPA